MNALVSVVFNNIGSVIQIHRDVNLIKKSNRPTNENYSK